MTLHLTARALPNTLLFHDWEEAIELWSRLTGAFPAARALCLMPNHPHVLTDEPDARRKLSGVMSGYARWRGHKRGVDAACWQAQPAAEAVEDADKVRRSVRYIHLNPCRGGLVSDPLSWPFSTHRDAVGLGDPARRVRDPEAFHRYVSSDPTVSVVGTPLPDYQVGTMSLAEVETAVGAVLRTRPGQARTQAFGRRLLLHAAVRTGTVDVDLLATWLGVGRAATYKLLTAFDPKNPWVSSVVRAVGDPRLGPLVSAPRANPRYWSGWRLA